MRRIAVLGEAARPNALRERVVHDGVWCDVPCEVLAALEAGLGVGEPRVVQVVAVIGAGRWGNMASGCRRAPLEATETSRDAARRVVVEAEMTRARRGRQHLGNDVEVDGRKESRRSEE